MDTTPAAPAAYAEIKKASMIKKALTNLGFTCKVRQHRFCVHIFLMKVDRLNPRRMANIDTLLQGIGMVPQFTVGRHLPTNIYSIQPIHEEA